MVVMMVMVMMVVQTDERHHDPRPEVAVVMMVMVVVVVVIGQLDPRGRIYRRRVLRRGEQRTGIRYRLQQIRVGLHLQGFSWRDRRCGCRVARRQRSDRPNQA